MITLLEINKAINDTINTALIGSEFASVELKPEDVTEPIIRPSIKVGIESSQNGKFNAECREKTLTCRVYFFAKDRKKYKIDNSKMQDLLENALLDGLYIGDMYIPFDEVETTVTDTVLVLSFDLYLIELLPEITISPIGEPIEPMETLKLKEEIQ